MRELQISVWDYISEGQINSKDAMTIRKRK